MTTTELLARLNTLRTAKGKSPLKSWKESRAKLEAAIAALDTSPVVDEAPVDTPVVAAAEAFADAVTKKTSPRKALENAPAPTGETISVSDLAREMGLNPKVVRAKLRRVQVPASCVVSKYVYRASCKDQVVEILKRDHRRK